MFDITVVILTKDEEKNITEAITSSRLIGRRVVVVDCGSQDSTVELAKKLGVDVYFHEWETHARQFNWALDCCDIDSEWIYRLDADERITPELADEIKNLNTGNISAYELRWQMFFMGQRLKHGGTHKTYVTRLFKTGYARYEDKAMDERLVVHGITGRLNNDFIHYDYKGLNAWIIKHIQYSDLELMSFVVETKEETKQQKKRSLYYRLPIFVRARLYYWYRYYFQLGFLDGKAGKIFIYLQAYWYRFIVDAKIYERTITDDK